MKKKEKATTSTALIPVITRALPTPQVIPKLTKSQIVKAMTEQARRNHKVKSDEYNARDEKILEDIKISAIVAASDGFELLEFKLEGPTRDRDDDCNYCAPSHATLEVKVTSPEVRTLLKRWYDNEETNPGYFYENDNEQKIKEAMDATEDKINLILAQPENVETINSLLAKIFVKKEDA